MTVGVFRVCGNYSDFVRIYQTTKNVPHFTFLEHCMVFSLSSLFIFSHFDGFIIALKCGVDLHFLMNCGAVHL